MQGLRLGLGRIGYIGALTNYFRNRGVVLPVEIGTPREATEFCELGLESCEDAEHTVVCVIGAGWEVDRPLLLGNQTG